MNRAAKTSVWLCWGLCLALLASEARSQYDGDCGDLSNAYGPFDYTNPAHKHDKLPVVETHHFDSDVESLVRGKSGSVISDIDYTLRAFPNHHRALYAVARYQLRGGRIEKPFRSAECYFDRAIRFKPDDGMVYMVYGVYLHRKGDLHQASEQYNRALALMPSSAEVHYNLGLLNVDLKDYQSAKANALRAEKLGYPLQGLKNKLRKLGVWREDKEGTKTGEKR